MKNLSKAASILKWIILAFIGVILLTTFCPICKTVYESYYSTSETTEYWYGSNYIQTSSLLLLVPVLAAVFLFTEFKSSKLFSYGFILAYVITNIYSFVLLGRAVKESGGNYTYTLLYGYYLMLIETVLLLGVVIAALVLYILCKVKEKNTVSVAEEQTVTNLSQTDIFKQRIELLNGLKDGGLLTEEEYEKKRSEIISELKV